MGKAGGGEHFVSRRLSLRADHVLVIVAALVGAAVGAYRFANLTPKHSASARLYVEPVVSPGYDVWTANGGNTAADWSPPTDLLLCTELGKIAAELGSLNELPSYAGVADVPLVIASHLSVEASAAKSGRGQIQDLKYTWTDPVAAERTLESVVAAYKVLADRWQNRHKTESLATLEKQGKALFERLQRKQQELEALRAANPGLAGIEPTPIDDARLKALVDARIRAELRRIDAEVHLATLSAVAGTGGGSHAGTASDAEKADSGLPVDLSLLADLDARWMDRSGPVERQNVLSYPSADRDTRPGEDRSMAANRFSLAQPTEPRAPIDLHGEENWVRRLEEVWGPDHPKLAAARSRLADLRKMATEQAGRSVRRAEALVRMCSEEESRLQAAIESHLASTSSQAPRNPSSVQAAILAQVIQDAEKALAGISQRIERLSVEAAVGGETTSVRISTMIPPHVEPADLNKDAPRVFLMPIGIGLLIGLAMVYLRSSGRPASAGPQRCAIGSGRPDVRRRRAILGTMPALPHAAGRGSQRALGTWLLREPRSRAAKALRTLARRLARAAQDAEARCVILTSAEPREGKSILAANVATALAQSGTRVLLAELNYTHPTQHVLLSDILELSPGAEISVGALESGRAVVRTQLETLRVLPAWPRPERPEQILRSAALREFVRQALTNHDLVLIDAPSLAESDDLDAVMELGDGVVVVVNSAGPEDETIRAAARTLGRIDLPSLGIVVNSMGSASVPTAAVGEEAQRGESAPMRAAHRANHDANDLNTD